MSSIISRIFAPFFRLPRRRPKVSAPTVSRLAPMRVRSLGHGNGMSAAVDAAMKAPQSHTNAIFDAQLGGFNALIDNPKLLNAQHKDMHLLHAVFAPRTSSSVAARPFPMGVRGVQMGAAQAVRGRSGHLHLYVMAWIPPA